MREPVGALPQKRAAFTHIELGAAIAAEGEHPLPLIIQFFIGYQSIS
jgi:hypothetical protein